MKIVTDLGSAIRELTWQTFRIQLACQSIRAYKKLTPEQKLQWLDEIFLFTEMALSPRARRVRQQLREGRKTDLE